MFIYIFFCILELSTTNKATPAEQKSETVPVNQNSDDTMEEFTEEVILASTTPI